jgi:hypothetical protein
MSTVNNKRVREREEKKKTAQVVVDVVLKMLQGTKERGGKLGERRERG